MAEHVRACFICGGNTSTLHFLPKKEDLRKKWLEFVFGKPPAKYNARLVICSNHFEQNDFTNYGAYSSGFVSKLSLKAGSVPSRRSITNSQASTSHTLMPTPLDTSTQTETDTCSCGSTQLVKDKLRSKGTQTESFLTSKSIATSTADASWEPDTSTAFKSEHPAPSKRPRLDEEDESEIMTLKFEPHDSTSEPAQSMSNVAESSPLTDTSSTGYKDSKYTVFEKNLMELFETCPECSLVTQLKTYGRGTFLSVDQKCHHCSLSKQCNSQPVTERTPIENVQLSAAIFFTGST